MSFTMFFEVEAYLRKNEQEVKGENNPQHIKEHLIVRRLINLQIRK